MASSTSGSSSKSNISIKPITVPLPIESLIVQIESPVDLASLKRNNVDMEAFISAQKMAGYFQMLNGPTYVNLVKEFWTRAEVFDVKSA